LSITITICNIYSVELGISRKNKIILHFRMHSSSDNRKNNHFNYPYDYKTCNLFLKLIFTTTAESIHIIY